MSVVMKRTVHVGDSRRLDTDPERPSSSESKCFCIVSGQISRSLQNYNHPNEKIIFFFLLTVFRVLTKEEQAEVIADDD